MFRHRFTVMLTVGLSLSLCMTPLAFADNEPPSPPPATDNATSEESEQSGTESEDSDADPDQSAQSGADANQSQSAAGEDLPANARAAEAVEEIPVTEPFASAWRAAGGAGGPWGEPVAPALSRNGWSSQEFRGGTAYAGADKKVVFVSGAILGRYQAVGGPDSFLGLPLAAEKATVKGGAFQAFKGGGVYWSPATGAYSTHGAIHQTWAGVNWERGYLGFPTSEEIPVPGGVQQNFEGGFVTWSSSRGGHVIWGAIGGLYRHYGGATSFLGIAIGPEKRTVHGGAYQAFTGGGLYWSPASGAHSTRGAIRDAWARQRWELGNMGFPTSEEYSVPGGVMQRYQGGAIFWSQSKGAIVVAGAVGQRYNASGGSDGYLGVPIGHETRSVAGGVYQAFTGGGIYWSPSTGAHGMSGTIFKTYAQHRWELGIHGYPVSEPYNDRGVQRQDFQHGSLWDGPMPGGYYQHTIQWAGQPNNYFCGATSGFMILRYLGASHSAQGVPLSISAVGSRDYMNTSGYGYTSFHDHMFERGMNRWLGANRYRTVHTPSVQEVRSSVMNSFVTGHPTAVDAQERRGGPHYNGHPNSTFSHIMVITAYDTTTDSVQMADPGATVLWGGQRHFWYPTLDQFTRNFLQVEVELDGLEHIGMYTS